MTHSQCLHILVTRPDPAGTALCARLTAGGDCVTHLPTVAFMPPVDVKAFTQAVATIAEQDWLIFISPQAVRASIDAIRHAWPDKPTALQLAAVGAGTAHALQQAGYTDVVYPENVWRSEGLLALPAFRSIAGKHIAIVRGEAGREYLAETLVKRGAHVSPIIAYRRVVPETNVEPVITLLKQHAIDVIICTSGDGIKNLKKIVGHDAWSFACAMPLVVVSERMKMLAQDLGFQTIWVAANAGHDAIMSVLSQKRKELCQKKQLKQS